MSITGDLETNVPSPTEAPPLLKAAYRDTATNASSAPLEAEDWRWVTVDALRAETAAHPGRFTAWLAGALERALAHPLLRAA